MSDQYVGRYAPTPSGWLHAGHLATFQTAQRRAMENRGRIYLRMEDIDLDRCQPQFEEGAREDMQWMGLQWDSYPEEDSGIVYQSKRLDKYRSALARLCAGGWVYPCPMSRKQIREHPDTRYSPLGEVLFPVSARDQMDRQSLIGDEYRINWRFRIPEGRSLQWNDRCAGKQLFTAAKDFGEVRLTGLH